MPPEEAAEIVGILEPKLLRDRVDFEVGTIGQQMPRALKLDPYEILMRRTARRF